MLVIGVDPGASGGIAVVDSYSGSIAVSCWKIDKSESVTASVFKSIKMGRRMGESIVAYVEKVHSFSGQGVKSCFSFGQSYGMLRGMLAAFAIDIVDVTPQKWQKSLGCRSGKGFTKTEHKRNLKEMAKEMCPYIRVTNATADAILIARYGWNVETGVYLDVK